MHAAAADTVIFGIDPLWYSSGLFILAYALIISDYLNRAVVAMAAACLMVLGGVLTQEAATRGIDFNTIGLLSGMMVIVGVSKQSGVFQFVAIWSAKRVNAHPWGILVMSVLVTAVSSALLDNVTTVLLIVPVTLLITEELELNPYPYLFSEIFASNIGGTATLIGDPPNIMIGSAVGLSFNDFLFNLAPVVVILLSLFLVPVYLIWGRKLSAAPELREKIMAYREFDAIVDSALLKKSLIVFALVLVGFVMGHGLGMEPASVALSGAALMLVLHMVTKKGEEQTKALEKTFCEIEWITIFFFIGLFVLVHGVQHAGLLGLLADYVVKATGGDLVGTSMLVLWVSAVASAVVDNIPFVATMIPMIQDMAPAMGGAEQLMPLWWSLALGACLGGNGSLIGASANVIVAGMAERFGQPIRFLPFMLMAFPLMLASIAVSSLYLYLRYL